MTDMTIRDANASDIPGIAKLLNQVLNVHHNGRPDLFKGNTRKYTDEQLREIIADPKRPIFVAADEAEAVVGYAFCVFQQSLGDNILNDMKTLYIDDLCVDESLRGRHIGSALYDFVIDFARKEGVYHVTLNVWSCNPGAMKFYKACGLVPYKIGMEKILE